MFVFRDSGRVEAYYSGIVHVINHVLCLGCWWGLFVGFSFLKGLRPFKNSVIIKTSSVLSANIEKGGKHSFFLKCNTLSIYKNK